MPPLARIVKPVAHDKFIRNPEAAVVYFYICFTALVLVKERADFQACGVSALQDFAEVRKSESIISSTTITFLPSILDLRS